jgi:hypothetical protein
MRFPSQPQASPEHWSKDFVEHLRTVHFALVTVSVGLIIILSQKAYDARAAVLQMSEVKKIVKALRGENRQGIDYDLSERNDPLSIGGSSQETAFLLSGDTTWFSAESAESPKTKYTFHIEQPDSYVCNIGGMKAAALMYPSTSNQSEVWLRSAIYTHLTPEMLPSTIGEFATWWDTLIEGPFDLDSIRRIAEEGGAYRSSSPSNWKPLRITGAATPTANGIDLSPGFLCEEDPKSLVTLRGTQNDFEFQFNVVGINRLEFTQQSLRAPLENRTLKWEPRPFSRAFPDLARATLDNLDDPIESLAARLSDGAAKGSEAFEAFGIKFPGDQVARWGIVVLIGVQLYLLLYLRRLSGKLKPEDPGWDVPWMAMDQSLFARIMFFVSLVVLPGCSAFLVIARAGWPLVSEGWPSDPSDLWQLLLTLAGVTLSAALSVVSWIYRPKLSQPVAPSQLFE